MQPQTDTQGEKETGRLEAFSDGVFAIAITLLVLELKVPSIPPAGATSAALGKALLQLWPSYFALVTSFFTILIMWMHHHAILRNVHRTDSRLHFSNGCLLLLISFVPYPTSVLAAYLQTPAAKMAAAFYAGTFVLVALCFTLFIYGAFRPHCSRVTPPPNLSKPRTGTIASVRHSICWPHSQPSSTRDCPWEFAQRYGFIGQQ
jgi:uncharacterized membrane protein